MAGTRNGTRQDDCKEGSRSEGSSCRRSKKGVEEGGVAARCFIPRHGIRVTHDGKTYDLLICFQCHHVYIYADNSDKPQTMTISDLPQKAFNKILTDAKVKLATTDTPEKPE